MLNYLVVEFLASKMVEIISSSWLTGIGMCLFPSGYTDAAKKARNHAQPEESLEAFGIKVLKQTGSLLCYFNFFEAFIH